MPKVLISDKMNPLATEIFKNKGLEVDVITDMTPDYSPIMGASPLSNYWLDAGWGTWGLLKDSVKLGLAGVPAGVDEEAVIARLASLPGVSDVHHVHIWAMSTTETALTAHLVMPGGHPGDAFLREAAHEMEHHHAICHTTFQVENSSQACEGCV